MEVSCLPSVRVLVIVLAGVVASCSEGGAADRVPQKAEGPPEHSVNMQRIRTLDCKGAFVCKQGQLLFITGEVKGYCLDLAGDPSSPVVLSDSLPPAWDVAVKGNHAFVAANSRMLSAYDMGDGKTWRKVADCSTPAAAENVIVRDDLAYVAGCRAGLQIVSIRDPKNPVLVGESTVAKQDIDAIGLVGNVAYLYDHLEGTLRLVDVTDPVNPKHLSLFEYGRPFIQGEMDVCGGYAYCVAGDDGVVIVDVRDRMAPKLAAVFDTPGHATDVIVSDGYAFVAAGEGGIRVADVRDPGKPVEVGCFTSKDLNARQLALLKNLVYVANEPPLRAVILRFEPPPEGPQASSTHINNKLPEGNNGIAARYPGDVGIESDSAVFFAEDFEDISSFRDLRGVFDAVGKERNVSIVTDADHVNSGRKALAFQVSQENGEVSNRAQKILAEHQDVVFLRFYSKLDENWEHIRSCHNGGHISGNYFVDGRATAGQSARTRPKFCALVDIFRFDPKAPHPGRLEIYCYYSEQNRGYGDNIFPNGMVGGKQKISGPGFVPRPDVVPERGRWHCYELMARMNIPGKRNGRIACWLDGKIILDFPNMALREEEWLKIDRIGIGLHVGKRNTPRANIKKYYDDIVAATSYIGPRLTPAATTED